MDKKEFVDLGTNGYGDYPYVLKAKIEKVCNNYFPYYLPNEAILDIFQGHYETNRRESGLVKMIEKLKDEALLAKPKLCQPKKESQKIVLIPDGCQYKVFEHCFNHRPEYIRSNYRDNLWKSLFEDENGIWNDEHHCQSTIRFMRSMHNYFIFIFPRIVDADYALIFKEIFSLQRDEIGYNRSSESELKGEKVSSTDFPERDRALFNFGKTAEAPVLDLSGFSNLEKERIHQCMSYLLDFILGYLSTDCDSKTISPEEKEKISAERQKTSFKKKLEDLAKKINYHPSKIIADEALERVGDASLKEGDERKSLRKVMYFIADNCTKKRLSLPEFYIYIPRLLELYCFAMLKKLYPSLLFKKSISILQRQPDMLLENKERTLCMDVKNKTDYFYTCVQSRDERQMINDIGRVKGWGLILYPDMTVNYFEEIEKNIQEPPQGLTFKKVGFSLPHKSK